MTAHTVRPFISLIVPAAGGSWDYHDYHVLAAQWSLDGQTVYLAGDSGEVFALNGQGVLLGRAGYVRSRKRGATDRGGKIRATLLDMAVSVNGDIAVCSEEGHVVVYSEQLKHVWSVSRDVYEERCAVAWSPDGQVVALACEDGAVRLWRVGAQDDAPYEVLRTPRAERAALVSLVWSPDGGIRALDVCGALWSLSPDHKARRHPVTFGASGRLALGAASVLWVACAAGLWRVEGDEAVCLDATPTRAVAAEVGGGRGVAAMTREALSVWSGDQGLPAWTSSQTSGYRSASIALSPDSQWLAVAPAGTRGALIYVGDCFGGSPVAGPAASSVAALDAALAVGVREDARGPHRGDAAQVVARLGKRALPVPLLERVHEHKVRAVVAGEVLAMRREGDALSAMCLRTGRLLWALDNAGSSASDVLEATDDAVLTSVGELLVCLDARSGQRRWSHAAQLWRERSMVIAQGRLFLCADGGVTALDMVSGERLWRWREPSDAAIEPPLALADGALLFMRASRLIALNVASGALLWDEQLPDSRQLTVAGDVVVGWEYGTRALGLADGAERWVVREAARQLAMRRVGELIVVLREGHVSALEASSGAERWRVALGAAPKRQRSAQPPEGAYDDALWVVEDGASSLVLCAWGKRVVALRVADGAEVAARKLKYEVRGVWWAAGELIVRDGQGTLRWSGAYVPVVEAAYAPAPLGAWRREVDEPAVALAVGAAQGFAVCGGALCAFELGDGAQAWSARAQIAALDAAGGAVVAVEQSGLVRARDASGQIIWTSPQPWNAQFAGVRCAGALVVIADWTGVAVARRATGEVVWQLSMGCSPSRRVAVAEGMVLMPVKNGGELVALELESGAERWRLGATRRDLYVHRWAGGGGRVAVSCWSLHVVDAASGALCWSRATSAVLGMTDAVVYASSGGAVLCLSASDGAELWRWSLGELDVVKEGALEGDALHVLLESGDTVVLDAACGAARGWGDVGAVVERAERVAGGWMWSGAGTVGGAPDVCAPLAAVDVEAQIEALGGGQWRRAAARLSRVSGDDAARRALETMAADAREEVREAAKRADLGWRGGDGAGSRALSARLAAIGLGGAPGLIGSPAPAPQRWSAGEAGRVRLSREIALGHLAWRIAASADEARVVVTDYRGASSALSVASGAVIGRLEHAQHLAPLAMDGQQVLLCGRGRVSCWRYEEERVRWTRALCGHDHEVWLEDRCVWVRAKGAVAQWGMEDGRWLGGRWYDEADVDRPGWLSVPSALVGEPDGGVGLAGSVRAELGSAAQAWPSRAAGVVVMLVGASYNRGQELCVMELEGGRVRWREKAGMDGLYAASVWRDAVVAWGTNGMVARRLSDGAALWQQVWSGGGEQGVVCMEDQIWAACKATVRIYEVA